MDRQQLLEIATAIHFLPSAITDEQVKLIADSIGNDLNNYGYFTDDTIMLDEFIKAATL